MKEEESVAATGNKAADEALVSAEISTGKVKPSVVSNIHTAVRCKEEGNRSFSEGDLNGAMQSWHQGLLHVAGINSFASMYGAKSTPAQNEKAQELTNAFRLNLAQCYIKQERYDKVIYVTTKVLETDDRNLKARYRRSLAYLRLKDSQNAAADLDIALEQAPKDLSIRRLAAELVEQEEDRIDKAREEEAARLDAEENQRRQLQEADRHQAKSSSSS